VFDLGFDLANSLKTKVGQFANRLRGLLRHNAGFGERLRGRNLNLQPGSKAVLFTPDAAHLLPRIAWDQSDS
jgi:hypothetical protein